jgi:hypothetical protein
MAIPAGVTHIRFGGALADGERWETGFWVFKSWDTNTAINSAAQGAYNSLIGTGDLWTVLAPFLRPQTTLDHVRLYTYAAGGTKASLIGEYLPTTPPVGSFVGSTTLPLQAAIVATLRTLLPGRRNRGRMYLPWNAPGTTNGGQSSVGNLQTITNGLAKTFADLIVSGQYTGASIVVVSQVGGTTNNVRQVSCDTRFDVQRRRANKQTIAGTASTTIP